ALPGWTPSVLLSSAISGKGIPDVWSAVGRYRATLGKGGLLERRRADQARAWMWSEISEALLAQLRDDEALRAELKKLEAAVAACRIARGAAADGAVEVFLARGRGRR